MRFAVACAMLAFVLLFGGADWIVTTIIIGCMAALVV